MALSFEDGALAFVATIDTDSFTTQIQKMEKELQSSLQSIEDLRAKMLVRQDLLVRSEDITKINIYNKQIELLQEQITKLQNAGKTGFDSLGNEIVKQLGLIDQLKAKISNFNVSIGSAQSTEAIATLRVELQAAEAELARLNNIGKAGFDALGNAIVVPIGLVDELKNKASELQASILKATSPEQIAVLNQELAVTVAELNKLKNAGTEGFDNLGNKLKVELGLIDQLRAKSIELRSALGQATSPEKIAVLNTELEATNAEMKRLSNVGKSGFDSLGNEIESTTKKGNLLGNAFGFIRQAAYLIPGIGVAGIFNLIGEAVVNLITALLKGKDAINTLAQNYKNAMEVMANANKEAGKQTADLKILYQAATDVNLSLKDRLVAVKGLQTEFPDYFKNINAETILNGKAADAYNAVAASIQTVARATAAKAKIDELEAQRLDIAFQKQKINTATTNEKNVAAPATYTDEEGRAVVQYTKAEQQALIEQRRLKAIREQDAKDASLDQQEKFLISFVGEANITKAVVDETKNRIAKVKKLKKEASDDALLQEGKNLLNEVAVIKRNADDSGLTKDQNEIDKVNQKYDAAIRKITEYNDKVDAFNKKNPHANVPEISADATTTLNNARAIELANTQAKQDAAKYIAALDDKKKAFEEFQKIQLEGNDEVTAKASELYKNQIGEFKTYLEYLKSEQAKLYVTLATGTGNIGTIQALQAVTKLIGTEQKNLSDQLTQKQLADFKRLLDATKSYNDQRKDLEIKYQEDVNTLNKNFKGDDLQRRLKILKDSHTQELTDLQDNLAHQSEAYKTLNEDLIRYTRDQLKERLDILKKYLSDGYILEKDGTKTTITPQMKADLEAGIKQAKDFLNLTKEIFGVSVSKIKDVADSTAKIGSSLGALGTALTPLNEELGQAITQMAQVAIITSNVATSIAGFASGDIGAGISGAAAAITGIVSIFNGADYLKFQEEIKTFNDNIFLGEEKINELYRQRTLEQAKINKLKLQGLEEETKALANNLTQAQEDYDKTLKALQGQRYKDFISYRDVGQAQATMHEVSISLAGKSFDEIEKLYNNGQLTGQAQAYFEELQKLKNEIADTTKAQADLKAEIQQTFTGTTSDAITDMIVKGFADGKTAVADFAQDTESLIRGALLNALKYKALQAPIQALYDQFAADAESNGGLDLSEVQKFQTGIANAIKNAEAMAQQLQQATGITLNDPNAAGSTANSLTGAIKGMTTQQADLLAGQFGGLRLTAIDQLHIMTSSLNTLNQIELNTSAAVQVLSQYYRKWDQQGLRVVI